MSIPRALRSVWFIRALILIVSHALAVQSSQNAVTDVAVPADVIIAAPSGEGNFPADFKGESNIVATTVITWSAPQNIAGDSDVITGGSLVGAVNLGDDTGSPGSPTVNGVTFQALAISNFATTATSGSFTLSAPAGFLQFPNGTFGSANTPFTSLSSSYQSLLNSALTIDSPNTFTLTMSGLVLGHQYKFQWFANTSGTGAKMHSASAGNTITLTDNVTGLEGGRGQFAVGTFVADSSNQVITFSAIGSMNVAQLNGFQLRDFGTVPEPSGVILTLIGLGALACRRTRTDAVWRRVPMVY